MVGKEDMIIEKDEFRFKLSIPIYDSEMDYRLGSRCRCSIDLPRLIIKTDNMNRMYDYIQSYTGDDPDPIDNEGVWKSLVCRRMFNTNSVVFYSTSWCTFGFYTEKMCRIILYSF